MSKLVFGVGVNDGSRPTRIDGNKVKEYLLWFGILTRGYNEDYKQKYPTYKDVTISDDFLNYAYFYDWCNNQIGFNKNGWELDKDILSSNCKVYDKDTACFVPKEINYFFTNRGNDRGEYPVGVNFHKATSKYASACAIGNGKRKHLGIYNTPQEAFFVYKAFKEALCKQLALKWKDEIDPRVYESMIKWEVSITS